MKYIKTYEKYEKPKNTYWKIRTDIPYFEISLDRIGMVEDEETTYIRMRNEKHLINKKYIYIGLNYDINTTGTIGSEFYWANDTNPFVNDYEYDGEIEITPEEIEEWHLKNDANKYNL